MKLIVVGAGPSGLYFALLAKSRFPKAEIDVFEQNPRGATYGFGIVLADRGLHQFRDTHYESYAAITNACFMTRHRVIKVQQETIFVEGGEYGGAIARLHLLHILETFCRNAGVSTHYEQRIADVDVLGHADLVVGADGVNSTVRSSCATAFGTTSRDLTNRCAWYATERHFPYPMLSFKKNELGHFVAAAYPYTERIGTFVAECDANTWVTSGLHEMDEERRRELAERVFADELQGQRLISNKSNWNCLPVVRNDSWHVGNRVLIGDALHSAHPTIGSGTRIAMEDSVALADALSQTEGDVSMALPLFRKQREPAKQKLVIAAEKSFTWYESFAERLDALPPVDFVFDFMMRTGRVDIERLKAGYPDFMKRYAGRWHGPDREPASGGIGPQARRPSSTKCAAS